MARCKTTRGLEVHHINRAGGNGIANAQILCGPCHEATRTYGAPGTSPPPFSQAVKDQAMRAANNQCECNKTGGCH